MQTASDTSEKDLEISELKKKLEEMEKNHLDETKKALEREELFQTERRKLEEEKNQWKGEKIFFNICCLKLPISTKKNRKNTQILGQFDNFRQTENEKVHKEQELEEAEDAMKEKMEKMKQEMEEKEEEVAALRLKIFPE